MADDDDELDELWSTEAKPPASVQELKKPAKLVVNHRGNQPYTAVVSKDRVQSFVVRSFSSGIRYRFFYHTLTTTAIHEPGNDCLTIITQGAVIEIYGRHLEAIDDALGLRTCSTITEYSAELFLPPPDNNAPFIERIEVLLPTPAKKKQEPVAKREEKSEEQGVEGR